MLSNSITLYKLMILYMLNQVNFPLNNTQLSNFFLSYGYAKYFEFQNSISQLVESELVTMEVIHNTTRYNITPSGIEALGFFGNTVSKEIIADIDNYIKENKFKMRNEASTTAEYHKEAPNEYIINFKVQEGRSTIINLELNVPDETQAELMVENWKNKSQDIYQYVMRTLMKND